MNSSVRLRMLGYLFLLHLIGFLNSALAAEWREVELSGSFTAATRAEGVGQVSYSFAMEKVIEQGGDIHFWVDFSDSKSVSFFLDGTRQIGDLGALKQPPTMIDPKQIRESFGTDVYSPPKRLLLGHYYYLVFTASHVILQPTSFRVDERKGTGKVVKTGLFSSGSEETGRCTLKFRYISSDKSLEELNGFLSGKIVKSTSTSTPPKVGVPDNTPKGNPAPSSSQAVIEQDPFLKDYEQFQKDSKVFIDSKPPQATVKGCDGLLNRATELDTNMETLLITLGADIKSMEVKVRTLEDRLQITTNLQIKDRMQTLITDLKKQKEDNEQKQREWAARRKELLDAKKNLYDYRGILEIMESK